MTEPDNTPDQTGWGEFQLIGHIRGRGTVPSERVRVGPGDDCAVLACRGADSLVVTIDTVVEGTHFTLKSATLEQVGAKACLTALSDVAAMGVPAAGMVAAAVLPRAMSMDEARRLEAGMQQVARRTGVPIVGGDITSTDARLVVTVTVLGFNDGLQPVLRSGARPGQPVVVTGRLGGSLTGRHLEPTPRLAEAVELNRRVRLGAMIDLSDGLSSDLWHILDESGVGADLDERAIPVSDAAGRQADDDGRSALEHALCDGEDFELLFTVDPDDLDDLLAEPPGDIELSVIGTISSDPGCRLHHGDGTVTSLERGGWEHRMG